MSPFLLAFSLTALAGLSTGLGGLVVLSSRQPSTRLLAAGLGMSAGVMIYVSFAELLPVGTAYLAQAHPNAAGWLSLAAFFGGITVIGLIDRLVPAELNPHEPLGVGEREEVRRRARLMRTGLLTAAIITLHNMPEGFATLVSGLEDPATGAAIAIAIAIHNIPEGAAVAIPIHHATRSRRRAMKYAVLSGLSEPLGALLLYVALRPFISSTLLGACLVAVAGVMVFVSLDELLPTAEKYGQHHAAIYGLVAGMAAMAVSLELLAG